MKYKKYRFEKPKSDDVEGEDYFLNDPQDFAEYCQLIRNGSATEQQHDEFHLRMIDHFILNGNKSEKWVLDALRNAFTKVINGGRWEDEFPLPWTKSVIPHTRAEWSALNIYCDIMNALAADPNKKIIDAINIAAADHAVSYENARAAYYTHKKRFSKLSTKT